MNLNLPHRGQLDSIYSSGASDGTPVCRGVGVGSQVMFTLPVTALVVRKIVLTLPEHLIFPPVCRGLIEVSKMGLTVSEHLIFPPVCKVFGVVDQILLTFPENLIVLQICRAFGVVSQILRTLSDHPFVPSVEGHVNRWFIQRGKPNRQWYGNIIRFTDDVPRSNIPPPFLAFFINIYEHAIEELIKL